MHSGHVLYHWDTSLVTTDVFRKRIHRYCLDLIQASFVFSIKRNPTLTSFILPQKDKAFGWLWVEVVEADAGYPPLSETDSVPAHAKLSEVLYKDFSNSLDHLWMFILFLLSNFRWFNKKRWYLEIKFREDLSRCWWYKVFAECPLCFISRNCFVNICYILYL